MHDNNPGKRQHGDFSFEHYVERQFCLLHERLTNMTTLAEKLGVDEEVLAAAIPALITEVGTLTQGVADEKTAKEQAVTEAKAAQEQAAGDEAALADANTKLAAAEAELSAVEAIEGKLAPVAEAAKEATTPAAGSGSGSGGDGSAQGSSGGQGGEPTAELKPRYTFAGADPSTIDTSAWTLATVRVPSPDLAPLYEFAGDVAGGAPTGATAEWVVYDGPTEPIPAGDGTAVDPAQGDSPDGGAASGAGGAA